MKKLAFFFFVFVIALTSRAQTNYTWDGSAGTDWETPANWTPEGNPGSSDSVLINSDVGNQPTLNSTVTISQFIITEGQLQITDGASLTITDTATHSNGAVLLVGGSTLQCTNANYVMTGGFLSDADGATFQVSGAGKKVDHQGGTVLISGELTAERIKHSGGTMTFNPTSVVTINNILEIASGVTLTSNGTLTGNGQLQAFGALNITGSGADFVIDGDGFIPGGSITVDAGSVEFKNSVSFSQGASLTLENNATFTVNPGNLEVKDAGSNIVVNQGTLNVTIGDINVNPGTTITINDGGQLLQGVTPPVK